VKFRITYLIIAFVVIIISIGILFYVQDNSFHVSVKPEYVKETFQPTGYEYIFNLTASNHGPLGMSATVFFQIGYLNASDEKLVLENYTIPISLAPGQEFHKTITAYLNISDVMIVGENGTVTYEPEYSIPQLEVARVLGTGTYGWRYSGQVDISSSFPILMLANHPPVTSLSGQMGPFPTSVSHGEALVPVFNNTAEVYYPNESAYFTILSLNFQKYNNDPHVAYLNFTPGYYNVTFHVYNENISKYFNFPHVVIGPGSSFSVPYPISGYYNITVTIQGNGIDYSFQITNLKYQP